MPEPALVLKGFSGWHGKAHVVQDIDLQFIAGRLAVVGRNGMGKTTLCDAITGMLTLEPRNKVVGSASLFGEELVGHRPHQIARLGIGYVPQGRRVFGSLTTEENLTVAQRKGGEWTTDRVYDLFPRLHERRRVAAGQLSGGEQQMLAVGRALVTQPRLLIMDEPSEGLAPVIVDVLTDACRRLSEAGLHIIVVEQNLGAALAMADAVIVIANGRVVASMSADELRSDVELQRRFLGISPAMEDAG